MCFYVYTYRALLLLPPPEGSPIDPVQTTRNHISRHLIARNAEILQQLLPDAIVASVSLWPPSCVRSDWQPIVQSPAQCVGAFRA